MNEVTRKAIERIERGWCQGASSENVFGEKYVPLDTAVKVCLLTAVTVAQQETKNYSLIHDVAAELVSRGYSNSLVSFNDQPGRTKEEVIELLTVADTRIPVSSGV
jgi:hypothetical protein